jgi:hypothetical protein
MRAERRLLRIGEYLIARACQHLSAEARDERYREWVAELPAILRDPDVRPAARRAARMLRYASGTIRGTALAPGSARRVLAYLAGEAVPLIAIGLVVYLMGWVKTPHTWIFLGIGWLLGSLIRSGWLAYRRMRGKDSLANALVARAAARVQAAEVRARTRAQTQAASILQARASAGFVNSTTGYTAGSFPRHKLGPGYRAAEVDEIIARIEATLSGNARPGQAITAADVQTVKFNVTRHGGYDELTMDEVLDHYAHELDQRTSPAP